MDSPLSDVPRLLVLTTVARTIRTFLTPYGDSLREAGWRVEAAAQGATSDPAILAAFDAVHELPMSRSVRNLGAIARSWGEVSALLGDGYDIVHVHTPIAGFITRAAIHRIPRERRPAAVYTAHGFHFHRGGRRMTNGVFLTLERVAGRWTDRLVVINDDDEAAARRYRIVPPSRLVRMPGIGIDTRAYARDAVHPGAMLQASEALGIPPGAPMFVVVAELSANKRPLDIALALARMHDRTSHLVYLGEDGSETDSLRELVAAQNLSDRIHLAGMVGDVRPYVAQATALVLASKREGLPRSIMEALALEVPVITSASRGSPDLVGTDAGIVVPIGDTSALAAAMDRIVADPAAAKAMGRAGRRRMVERYEYRHVVRRHITMYEGLLASRRRPTGRR